MTLDFSSYLLDAIHLVICNNTDLYKDLAKAIRDIYEELGTDNITIRTSTADLYSDMIKALLDPDTNINKASDRVKILTSRKHHPAFGESTSLFDQLYTIFKQEEQTSQRRLNSMERRVRSSIIFLRQRKLLNKMYAKQGSYIAAEDPAVQDIVLSEMLQHSRDLVAAYETGAGHRSHEVVIDSIDLSDKNSVAKALTAYKAKRKQGVFKTGLQGINELLSPSGGFCKGEFVVVGGLTHNYKSGILKDITRWIITMNSPGTPPGVIPTVVFISLENEAFEDMMEWYRALYIHTYHKNPDDLPDEEVINQITTLFVKRGFQVLIYRKLGESFGFGDFVKLQDEIKASGRHVVATIIDYASLMKIEVSKIGGNLALAIQTLHRALKDYANHTGQLIVTGAQLNAQAADIAAATTNAVKKFSSRHFSDCTAIGKEADCILFIHIEEANGIPFLTIAWYKRRYCLPPKRRFVAYRFRKMGIMDDIDGESQAVYNIYAVSNMKPDDDEDSTVAQDAALDSF